MDNNSASRVKKQLEDAYDIPFDVHSGLHFKDAWYKIKPLNNDEELFDIEVKYKNQLRIIIEVTPQRYAAFSIKDMSAAPDEKKRIFAEYARQLAQLKAKTEFFINDSACNPIDPESWPEEWENYRLRVSRSPIVPEDEAFDEVEITTTWAAIVTGMFLSLLNITQTEENELWEGGVKRIEINRYERNPINRELCLAANGYKCKICGFDFEKKYGTLGHHFIHVHHITPVSKMSDAYVIDPVKDLIPVCPNCHAMLHQSDPPLMPEELKEIISNNEDEASCE